MPSRRRSLVLAMDIGSSSLRTALFTEAGARLVASTASQQYSLKYTGDGGAELEPAVLLRSARSCVSRTLRVRENSPKHCGSPILAVAGSAFWHSLLGLDRSGWVITPVFTWADSRSTADAAALRRTISERRIQLRTGCMLRAAFWPAKLHWLRRTRPSLFKNVQSWVSPAAWIFRELFGFEAISHSMASGTGLYNLPEEKWDADLCDLSDVGLEQLGPLRDSARAKPEVRKELRDAVIFAAIGDGAASNLGSGADAPGKFAINVGTSGAVRALQRKDQRPRTQVPRGLFKYVVDRDRFVIGGAVSNAGNLHRWCLRELLGGEKQAEKALSRTAAAEDSLTVLPFWVNERAPTWPVDLRGTITGLTPVTTAADVFRAAATSTFYRLAEILEQLQSVLGEAEEVIVSGGILHSPASLAILADSLGCEIRVCREPESSLRGASILALEQLGQAVKAPPAGQLIRHRAALAAKHRARREEQNAFEQRLA